MTRRAATSALDDAIAILRRYFCSGVIDDIDAVARAFDTIHASGTRGHAAFVTQILFDVHPAIGYRTLAPFVIANIPSSAVAMGLAGVIRSGTPLQIANAVDLPYYLRGPAGMRFTAEDIRRVDAAILERLTDERLDQAMRDGVRRVHLSPAVPVR